jgi:hypothetical protein
MMKVYKIFNMKDGKPHALFVNAQKELPIGEWIPAEDTPHYTADNGKLYVKGNKGQALAYRPGWHSSSLPFFPQGGCKDTRANAPYPCIHSKHQEIFECEIAGEDCTAEAQATKLGYFQHLPNGYYQFTTNFRVRRESYPCRWFISDRIKLVRQLSHAECDELLAVAGLPPQEWEE